MLKDAKTKIVDGLVRQYLPLVIGAIAGAAGSYALAAWPAVYSAFCVGRL